MSVSTKFNPKILIAFDKWEMWRIINSLTIIIAFFLPWIVMLRDITTHQEVTFTGFRLLQWYQGSAKFEVLIQKRELLDRLRVAMLAIPYFLGLYSILIYCVLNIVAVVSTTKFAGKRNWNKLVYGLFIAGIINLLYMVGLDNGYWIDLSLLVWGYWLIWIGLVSSALLEISYSLKKKVISETF